LCNKQKCYQNLNFGMKYIYIIINPKYSKSSLINITEQSLKEIITGLNNKYANPNIDNDFYKLVYAKEIIGENSKLLIKNININPSRVGVITILKKMGAKILLKNKKNYIAETIHFEEGARFWNKPNKILIFYYSLNLATS